MVESKLKDLTVIARSVSSDAKFRALSHYSKQLDVRTFSCLDDLPNINAERNEAGIDGFQTQSQ